MPSNAAGAGSNSSGNAFSPFRPTWLRSVAVDGCLAASSYLAAYWLRFQGDHFDDFVWAAWSTMPIVVVGQLLGLMVAKAYAPRPRVDWLLRVALGIVLGTGAAALAIRVTTGFEGVSRLAFAADALLMTIAAMGWRGGWVLAKRLRRNAESTSASDLIDRAQQTTTVGAIARSLFSYRELLRNLVIKDLKLKYRGSVFGFLWSLANPLLMIAVYTFAFTHILHVRNEGFVFYLMLGVLSWTFFGSSAMMSTGAIVDNAGLLKSVFFPRSILPISTVLFNLAQYLLTIAVFLPLMILWYRVPLSAPMMLFPVFVALQCLFTIGVALMLATVTAFFRDVRHLLEIALQVLFWTTPIVYQLDQVSNRMRLPILMSPMSPFIVAYQRMFYYRQWPDSTLWIVAITYAVGAFVTGAVVIMAFEDRFAEQL
jgi:homopolymeric O-antigen transport system permease protein